MACQHGNPVYKCPECAAAIPKSEPETGWVIEHKNSEPCAPLYWAGNGWSREHMKAIRFARKEDAERTARGWDDDDPLPNEPTEHRYCEHAWG